MEHTTNDITLWSSGILRGGYCFLNLNIGRVITCNHFTIIPITQDVIDWINNLGLKENQPEGIKVFHGYQEAIKATMDDNDSIVPGTDASEDNDEPLSVGEFLFDDDDDHGDRPGTIESTGVLDRTAAELANGKDENLDKDVEITGVSPPGLEVTIDLTGPHTHTHTQRSVLTITTKSSSHKN